MRAVAGLEGNHELNARKLPISITIKNKIT